MQNCFALERFLVKLRPAKAEVAELVDALGLGSSVLGRAGSIPVLGISLLISCSSLFYKSCSFFFVLVLSCNPRKIRWENGEKLGSFFLCSGLDVFVIELLRTGSCFNGDGWEVFSSRCFVGEEGVTEGVFTPAFLALEMFV